MDDFTKETVLIVLKNMFQGSYFSICTIDKCLEITGCIPEKHEHDCLATLHCINWSEMGSAFRQEVLNRTLALF